MKICPRRKWTSFGKEYSTVCPVFFGVQCRFESGYLGFWMSDKPLVQQGLASELAEIVLSIPNIAPALAFLNGFWQTITREWSGIDRLRFVVLVGNANRSQA